MEIREVRRDEIEEALELRNSIFTPVDRDHWDHMGCTAVIARDGGRVVGFIPLQFRSQCIRPGVHVPVVYENAVGVAEGERSRGIGTAMINEASRFISGRVSALMVIRGGERTNGYAFYRKSGHSDLCYARSYSITSGTTANPDELPGGNSGSVCEVGRAQWIADEKRLLEIHAGRYSQFGGARRRSEGYWTMILDSHVYRARRWRLLEHLDTRGAVDGYLVGVHGDWKPGNQFLLYESVAEGSAALEELIREAARTAGPEGLRIPAVSISDPLGAELAGMGFVAQESSPQIMCRIVDPRPMFSALCAGSALAERLSLTIDTPHRSLVLSEPARPRYSVHLQTKEQFAARLLCCRLDLAAAVEMEMVRCDCNDQSLFRELCDVFRYTEWVQSFVDYV